MDVLYLLDGTPYQHRGDGALQHWQVTSGGPAIRDHPVLARFAARNNRTLALSFTENFITLIIDTANSKPKPRRRT